jgi:hypothetical protein
MLRRRVKLMVKSKTMHVQEFPGQRDNEYVPVIELHHRVRFFVL